MKTLNALTKRDMLASKKFDAEELRAYGEEYFAEERYGDAFEFYRKAGDRDGVQRVKEAIIALCDVELLWRIEHTMPDVVSKEDWSRCGEKGMELGKFRNAAYAFRHIGDAEREAAAEKEFPKPAAATPST